MKSGFLRFVILAYGAIMSSLRVTAQDPSAAALQPGGGVPLEGTTSAEAQTRARSNAISGTPDGTSVADLEVFEDSTNDGTSDGTSVALDGVGQFDRWKKSIKCIQALTDVNELKEVECDITRDPDYSRIKKKELGKFWCGKMKDEGFYETHKDDISGFMTFAAHGVTVELNRLQITDEKYQPTSCRQEEASSQKKNTQPTNMWAMTLKNTLKVAPQRRHSSPFRFHALERRSQGTVPALAPEQTINPVPKIIRHGVIGYEGREGNGATVTKIQSVLPGEQNVAKGTNAAKAISINLLTCNGIMGTGIGADKEFCETQKGYLDEGFFAQFQLGINFGARIAQSATEVNRAAQKAVARIFLERFEMLGLTIDQIQQSGIKILEDLKRQVHEIRPHSSLTKSDPDNLYQPWLVTSATTSATWKQSLESLQGQMRLGILCLMIQLETILVNEGATEEQRQSLLYAIKIFKNRLLYSTESYESRAGDIVALFAIGAILDIPVMVNCKSGLDRTGIGHALGGAISVMWASTNAPYVEGRKGYDTLSAGCRALLVDMVIKFETFLGLRKDDTSIGEKIAAVGCKRKSSTMHTEEDWTWKKDTTDVVPAVLKLLQIFRGLVLKFLVKHGYIITVLYVLARIRLLLRSVFRNCAMYVSKSLTLLRIYPISRSTGMPGFKWEGGIYESILKDSLFWPGAEQTKIDFAKQTLIMGSEKRGS